MLISILISTNNIHHSLNNDLNVQPKIPSINVIQMKVNSCNTLVDAMRFQAANNKEVCDEMVAKAKNFETSVKLEDPKEAWNWKK